jgi:hypothetical protein
VKIISVVFLSLFISLVYSCSQAVPKRIEKQMKQDELVNQKSKDDLSRYTLSGIPQWANFSQTGKCQRSGNIAYYDLLKLHESYGIAYSDAIHFQHIYNVLLKQQKENTSRGLVSLKDEEIVFSETKERIMASNMIFKKPAFLMVYLIWIDPTLNEEKNLARLKSFLSNPANLSGHPVFVSMCLTESDLERYIEKNEFSAINAKIISAEFFSIFNSKFEKNYFWGIKLNELFDKNQKLNLFVPDKNNIPEEFKGKFEVENY